MFRRVLTVVGEFSIYIANVATIVEVLKTGNSHVIYYSNFHNCDGDRKQFFQVRLMYSMIPARSTYNSNNECIFNV